MCAIIDANTFNKFRDPADEDMKPVWNWLENKNGKLVYANIPKFEEEWERGGMTHIRDQLMRAGQLKLVSENVQEKANELKGEIRSDDEHIIALALIGGVRVLLSHREGDRDLITDFKNRDLIQGKVYTRKVHGHLLTKDTCP